MFVKPCLSPKGRVGERGVRQVSLTPQWERVGRGCAGIWLRRARRLKGEFLPFKREGREAG